MFPVFYGSKQCGSARLVQIGLYYKITCKCEIPEVILCKIELETNGKTMDLGTCIREGSHYCVETKIPTKYIEKNDISFYLRAKETEKKPEFVPVETDTPFPHLDRLHFARMAHHNGKSGVIFID